MDLHDELMRGGFLKIEATRIVFVISCYISETDYSDYVELT